MTGYYCYEHYSISVSPAFPSSFRMLSNAPSVEPCCWLEFRHTRVSYLLSCHHVTLLHKRCKLSSPLLRFYPPTHWYQRKRKVLRYLCVCAWMWHLCRLHDCVISSQVFPEKPSHYIRLLWKSRGKSGSSDWICLGRNADAQTHHLTSPQTSKPTLLFIMYPMLLRLAPPPCFFLCLVSFFPSSSQVCPTF